MFWRNQEFRRPNVASKSQVSTEHEFSPSLLEYKQGEFIHLAAVKDHPATPPKVDEVVFQTFQNQDALVQALVTGQVDMITEMPTTAVPTLRNAKDVKLVIGAPLSPDLTDIILNQTAPENCPPGDG